MLARKQTVLGKMIEKFENHYIILTGNAERLNGVPYHLPSSMVSDRRLRRIMNFFQTFYLTHFSEPKDEQILYRHIKQHRPHVLLECGIQRGERMLNMLRLARKVSTNRDDLEYVCTDPFEGRTEEDGPGLSLRKAHKLLSKMGIRHRCIPAPAETGVALISRSVKNVDLLVLATPSLDWLAGKGAVLAVALREDAAVFMKPHGKTMRQQTVFEFRRMIDAAVEADRKRRKAA